METIRAAACITRPGEVRRQVEIVCEGGRIHEIRPASALTDTERRTVVHAGLINAHVHLELGALADRVPADTGFLGWVGQLISLRDAATDADLRDGARRSASDLVASGTTTAIDIDSLDLTPKALEGHSLRVVSLVELIDGSPDGLNDRSEAALERALSALAAPASTQSAAGWSPHGAHTVGDALLRKLGEVRRVKTGDAPLALACHWAETEDETRWLRDGSGPFSGWLGPSPKVSGLERLARAGMLDRSLLVHGNYPEPGDPKRIATAHAAVVHCPGSHLFFGRDPFPLAAYEAAGATVLLGTDSRASNGGMDMRREMRLAVRDLGVSPERALAMATVDAAAFLPWPDVTGTVEVGSRADLVAILLPTPIAAPPPGARELAESAIDAAATVTGVWISGIRI